MFYTGENKKILVQVELFFFSWPPRHTYVRFFTHIDNHRYWVFFSVTSGPDWLFNKSDSYTHYRKPKSFRAGFRCRSILTGLILVLILGWYVLLLFVINRGDAKHVGWDMGNLSSAGIYSHQIPCGFLCSFWG